MIDEPTSDPLDPDEVSTTLAEQLAIDRSPSSARRRSDVR